MGRRSRQSDTAAAAEAAKALVSFSAMPSDTSLRDRALALAPIIHAVRDVGSGLVPGHKSGRARILAYLRKFPGEVIAGEELAVVAGIDDWARRVRELRIEKGWPIYSGVTFNQLREHDPDQLAEIEAELSLDANNVGIESYVLLQDDQDQHAADHWTLLKSIRKSKGGVQDKMLALLRSSVGQPISGEQFRYVAGKANEWPRRLRELRTEQGWPVLTRMQGRPDLPVGSYMLDFDRQVEVHDRKIPDRVRSEVLSRDKFSCRYCGWSRDQMHPDDKRKFLELHHLKDHAKGGANSAANLVTLCNVDHDAYHAGEITLPDDWP